LVSTKRKIAVVSGTRADSGLLFPLLRYLNQDPSIDLQLIVTGMHLSHEYGYTYKEFEARNFKITKKIEMLLSSDTSSSVVKSLGLGTIGFSDAFSELQPDLLVLLGDRYEILAAAQSAMIFKIPIAHIHGGETSEGAIDEAIRHSITKMSHLHFTSAEAHTKRVLQLGESENRVFTVGAPGLDSLIETDEMSLIEFEESISFKLSLELNFLITYHPVTLDNQDPTIALTQLFSALDQYPSAHIIFTQSNSDPAGKLIFHKIKEYASLYPTRIKIVNTLGIQRYANALRHVDIVLGNSSSGLIEAPLFLTPSINIGDRQKGRLKGDSVISCKENKEDIVLAIEKAQNTEFIKSIQRKQNPYGQGGASEKIYETVKNCNLDDLIKKQFNDLI